MGTPPRRTSGRFSDSTRTTSAPWSARYFAEIGPTPTHAKSATLMPSNGNLSSISSSTGVLLVESSCSLISAVCSPRPGAFRLTAISKASCFAHKPADFTFCPLGNVVACQYSLASICSMPNNSLSVLTGASVTRFCKPSSNNSLLDRPAKNCRQILAHSSKLIGRFSGVCMLASNISQSISRNDSSTMPSSIRASVQPCNTRPNGIATT